MSQKPNIPEEVTRRHKTYRAEKRTDPVDGEAYTWHVLLEFYARKGWSEDAVKQYWAGLDHYSIGRTRTKKKRVYPDEHPLAQARKRAAASGSKWEEYS